jgi:hypothetical protein
MAVTPNVLFEQVKHACIGKRCTIKGIHLCVYTVLQGAHKPLCVPRCFSQESYGNRALDELPCAREDDTQRAKEQAEHSVLQKAIPDQSTVCIFILQCRQRIGAK